MSKHEAALAELVDKEDIRTLAMLYSRGVDRKDANLLRSLYAPDATEKRPDMWDGPAAGFIDLLETMFPQMPYTGHHICQHLISLDGDRAQGEVYAVAFHIVSNGRSSEGAGGWLEIVGNPRYLDHYVRGEDGRWRFASREGAYDQRVTRPTEVPPHDYHLGDPARDRSYAVLTDRLFGRGGRQ